ncbi:MAG: hypothetical protein HXX08_09685 [Chloroflexi bacterium]|uniref:Uncharacterized protein n=1 Tax=Candidatus Chlorohelix allophototropha TaxID=3003348 RepID=A0A8T7LYV5_9CHLR|nr:hypothetical protein [Chloroflexota bacterium]WJW65515.1 hypothetical protein OZ401_001281 [Chloroflexota bacterium L227-S17]
MISQFIKILPRLMGWGFLILGGLLQAWPRQLGSLLGVDTKKRSGLVLVRILALREVIIGSFIVRAKDSQRLKQGILIRMLAEMSDFAMHMFGKGVFIQPTSRRIGYMIPPVLLVEFLIRGSIKEQEQK